MPRIAIVGSPLTLAKHAPAPGAARAHELVQLPPDGDLDGFDAIVALDPSDAALERLARATAPTLLWSEHVPDRPLADGARLVLTRPAAARSGTAPWRTVPLPVADALYAPADSPPPSEPRATWVGPPTVRRQVFDRHFGDAVAIEPDDGPESGAAVAVWLADSRDDGHGARVALARGRLLVAEPLEPGHGLEPGIDYLAARAIDDIRAHVADALAHPAASERVRLLGRRKAELFRASRVVERLAGDLVLEVAR